MKRETTGTMWCNVETVLKSSVMKVHQEIKKCLKLQHLKAPLCSLYKQKQICMFSNVKPSLVLHLVSTYICRRQFNRKPIHSYENLCDIRCACETPPLCNILVQNLPLVRFKNLTFDGGFRRDRMERRRYASTHTLHRDGCYAIH